MVKKYFATFFNTSTDQPFRTKLYRRHELINHDYEGKIRKHTDFHRL